MEAGEDPCLENAHARVEGGVGFGRRSPIPMPMLASILAPRKGRARTAIPCDLQVPADPQCPCSHAMRAANLKPQNTRATVYRTPSETPSEGAAADNGSRIRMCVEGIVYKPSE